MPPVARRALFVERARVELQPGVADQIGARVAHAQDEEPWNLPTPTMGGTQLWRDSHVFAAAAPLENKR